MYFCLFVVFVECNLSSPREIPSSASFSFPRQTQLMKPNNLLNRSDTLFFPLQVVFSRLASPHMSLQLDSRPVSTSVMLRDADQSGGSLLVATGNKVS